MRVAPANLTDTVKSAKVTQLSKAQKIQHPGADITIENEVARLAKSNQHMVLSVLINSDSSAPGSSSDF